MAGGIKSEPPFFMKDILYKLLGKRGIKLEELSKEEKQTFEEWNKVLSKDELTVADIKEFCKSQADIIENKWKDLNIEQSRKAELIPYHTVYKTLLQVIESPKLVREQLEQHLNQLIK